MRISIILGKKEKLPTQGLDRGEKSILDRIKVGDADDGDFDIISTREPLYFLPCFPPFFLRAYEEKFHTKHLVLVFLSIIPVLYIRGLVYLAMNKLHDYVLVLIDYGWVSLAILVRIYQRTPSSETIPPL